MVRYEVKITYLTTQLLQDGCILCDLMNKVQQQHSINIEETYQYIGYTLKKDLGDQLFYVRLNVETFVRLVNKFNPHNYNITPWTWRFCL